MSASSSSSILVSSSDDIKCKISPVVVFNILDHFMRRSKDQQRVIGTLLGANNEGVLDITNSFPVPHTEGETVGIDMDFHKTMFQLYKQGNPSEIILGWYSSGTDINEHSILIHDFYGREIQRPPVHVCVETMVGKNRLVDVKAFMSSSVTLKDRLFASHFAPVELDLSWGGHQQQVMEMLTKTANSSNGHRVTEVDRIEQSLDTIDEMLEKLQSVLEKDQQAAVGRTLQRAIETVGILQGKQWDQLYNASLQDILSIVYLGKLTKAQVQICENLQKALAPKGV